MKIDLEKLKHGFFFKMSQFRLHANSFPKKWRIWEIFLILWTLFCQISCRVQQMKQKKNGFELSIKTRRRSLILSTNQSSLLNHKSMRETLIISCVSFCINAKARMWWKLKSEKWEHFVSTISSWLSFYVQNICPWFDLKMFLSL